MKDILIIFVFSDNRIVNEMKVKYLEEQTNILYFCLIYFSNAFYITSSFMFIIPRAGVGQLKNDPLKKKGNLIL